MGLVFLFKDSRNLSTGHTLKGSTSLTMLGTNACIWPLYPTSLSPHLPSSQILSLLRASECWMWALWTVYFVNWYALYVAKLKWGGLERNFCCKKAWSQLLQRTDASEKWGLLWQRQCGNFSRKLALVPEFNEAPKMSLSTMYSADEIADWFLRNHSLWWW